MSLKDQRTHYGRVAALGCQVCRNQGQPGTPAEIHHLRDHTGAGRKVDYTEVIPLCAIHHRLGDLSDRCGEQLGYHVLPRTWEARYGTQRELLEQVRELLGERVAA